MPRIYNSGTDFHKVPGIYKKLAADGSILAITDPEEHRQYRNIVGSLFSRKTADDLAPNDAGLDADHYHSFMLSIDRFTAITWPNESIAAHDAGRKPVRSRCTYFDLMIEAQKKAGEPLRPDQLFDDLLNYLVAGMDATSYVLSFGTYFLLEKKPEAKAKLEAELLEASPFIRGQFDHRQFMALPYLTAVVKECLRLSNTVPGFLRRVVPKHGVDIGVYHIPGGTQISTIHPIVECNEEIFPNPHEFIPECWLDENSQDLEKWAISFSKGRRQCIGKSKQRLCRDRRENLKLTGMLSYAYMMLYAAIALFFSRLEMELYETTAVEMKIVDQFAPITKGLVKVKVTKDQWGESGHG
ncbi:cytochrome P450 [Aspergillus undulatus]|uniref:cytochrome P450 n=1 Tax=Aspergillus undulatus TaxID=1810928 RepID=UPI003CCDE387